jgi:transketolase
MSDERDVAAIARRIRARIVRMSHETGAPHLGSALSCVDLLVAAYFSWLNISPENANHESRDRLILSKGHAAAALYATLAEAGFFPAEWLDDYARDGGRLPEQMSPGCAPGVEAATGSLGHGLSLGVGMALAGRIRGQDYRVAVILSDGECQEGSVWEAAMFAAAQRVDNLTAIVDYNRWQATGRSNEVMALAPLAGKWAAFGWNAVEIDGHDPAAIAAAMRAEPRDGRPRAIVAHTVKGKGVSFMEDDNNWHYRIPTAAETDAACRELA